MDGKITHKGIITELHEAFVIVSVISESACASCHAKGACTVADTEEKFITIECDVSKYHQMQQVTVVLSEKIGLYAVLLAYVLPFLVLLISLIIFVSQFEETIAAIISFGMVGIYYSILYYKKDIIKKNIVFEIES